MKSKRERGAYRFQIYRASNNRYEYPNAHHVYIRGLKIEILIRDLTGYGRCAKVYPSWQKWF
jgi:hypothetical protein